MGRDTRRSNLERPVYLRAELLEIRVLEIATESVDPNALRGELRPDSIPQIAGHFAERIRIAPGRGKRVVLDESRHSAVVEQPCQHRILRGANPIQGALRLDPSQDEGIEEKLRRAKHVLVEELQRFALTLAGER